MTYDKFIKYMREEELKNPYFSPYYWDLLVAKEDGRIEEKNEIVQNMLKEKIPIQTIKRLTGLSEREILNFLD